MSDFSGLLEKTGKYAAKAADAAKGFASSMAKKTKTISQIAKLNVDIAAKRDTIKQSYTEIGKLYYESHKNDPEDSFAQLCQEIDSAESSIRDMEAEISSLKASPSEDESEDLETIVSETEEEADIEVEVTEDTADVPEDGEVHIDILCSQDEDATAAEDSSAAEEVPDIETVSDDTPSDNPAD